MASWQAHVLSTVLRLTFKKQLSKARDVQAIRRTMQGGMFPVPRDVRITEARIGQSGGEWVISQSSKPRDPVLLYLHGGGYIACNPKTHRPYTTWFARGGFRVYAPDYRLAPEHPFPAGLEDAVAAYRALRSEFRDDVPIVIAGDSAGGGLTIATLLRLRDAGDVELPAAAVLFSPLTDLSGVGASRIENDRKCAMFHGAGIGELTRYYLDGSTAPNDPLVSPLFADLKGLPPMLIHVGANETLRDDSILFAERARGAGVPVQLEVWPAVPHVWQLMHRIIPEGRDSLRAATAFLRGSLKPSCS